MVAVASNETDTYVFFRAGESGWGTTIGGARLNRDNTAPPTPVAASDSAAIAFPDDFDGEAGSEGCNVYVAIDTGAGSGDVYKVTGAEGVSLAVDLDVASGYGNDNVDITGLAVRGGAAGAEIIAGNADSSLTYTSTDGGQSWARTRKAPTGTSSTFLLFSRAATGEGTVYCGTSGAESALSISRDGGATWAQTGLIDTSISTILDVAPSPAYGEDGTLFLLTFGGRHGLWQSRNEGDNWECIFSSGLASVDSLSEIALSPDYGKGSEVIYLTGSSYGRPTLWKSADGGRRFVGYPTIDPDSGSAFTAEVLTVVSDDTLFVGGFDGVNGRVYRTENGGFFYGQGALVGSQSLSSLEISPEYDTDGSLLAGSSAGWVFFSGDGGVTFDPVPGDAGAAPLTGTIMTAFDPAFTENRTVYAVSNGVDKGVYRNRLDAPRDWERIDASLPSGGSLNQVILSPSGALYATNASADGGLERSLNATFSLGPTFETVTTGLADGATLSGLWQSSDLLWTVDSASTRLLTYRDSLIMPPPLSGPTGGSSGMGNLINHTITGVELDWEGISGASTYQWQLDYERDFTTLPSGFSGTVQATSVALPALQPATTYYWRVRVSSPAISPWSEKLTFSTALDTETVSLKLESPISGAASVLVRPMFQWSAVSGASSYELLVAPDVTFTAPCVVRTREYALAATAWQCDVSLDYDTAYFWKVRAVNHATSSAWSPVSGFTTREAPRVALTTPPVLPELPQVPASSEAPEQVQSPDLMSRENGAVAAPLPPLPETSPLSPEPSLVPWVPYLVGGLLVIIFLLLVVIMAMVPTMRRL